MRADGHAIGVEIVACVVFSVVAIAGFKWNMRYVAVGLIGHGLFDLVHHRFIANPGVPRWWPGFCMACDLVMGIWLLTGRREKA